MPITWEEILAEGMGKGSIVDVAREGRLARLVKTSYVTVGLTLVDEAVLALVERAINQRSNVTFVYPAPAGEVSVLLAAQILITRLVQGHVSPSVGIVTSDTTTVVRTWKELNFGRAGERIGLSHVFPCVRTGPNGEYTFERRRFKGLLVGRQFVDWPCDVVIRDRIAGFAPGTPDVPTINIFADPLDSSLEEITEKGEAIWGWDGNDLALLDPPKSRHAGAVSPFSVATDRFNSIKSGLRTTIHVSPNLEAEKCAESLKDDLMTLNAMAGSNPSPQLKRGLQAAWHHQRTLQTLPVRPSEFDRFGGMPPIAARPTSTYEPEMFAWARALGGEIGELAEIVSSDLADLRDALEDIPPFLPELVNLADADEGTLVLVANRTAARALAHALGGDIQTCTVGRCHIVSTRMLHRVGTWDTAWFVGMPPKWDWHRLDSGIANDLHVLVLGNKEASWAQRSLMQLRQARCRWASPEVRIHTWQTLVGDTHPPLPQVPIQDFAAPLVVGAKEYEPTPDPFEEFEPLLVSSRLFGEEGPRDMLAEESEDGRWATEVEAIEIKTDSGIIFLPVYRIVDVRSQNNLDEIRADQLAPGMHLIVNRTAGSLGLLDAVAERLRIHRPDLYVANLVIRDLRDVVRASFRRSGMSQTGFYRNLVKIGFTKTYQAARGYVVESGPLAPRDFSDLKRINTILELDYDEARLTEIFVAVKRERSFRRATGRALAAAARSSLAVEETGLVDDEIGLSVADLHELVLEAKILEIGERQLKVPLSETGILLGA